VADTDPVIRFREVSKDYRSLRPLRIASLDLCAGEACSLVGFDQAMAEVFVDLVTGRTVPDAGEIHLLGTPTTAIEDGDAWLKTLDTFGLVSERAVLLADFTIEQTLSMPFSFDFDRLPDTVRTRVAAVAAAVGLEAELTRQVATLTALGRQRLRLGCAMSRDPRLLVLEHPTVSLSADEAARFAEDVRRVVGGRTMATVVLTPDRGFGEAATGRVLVLQPATGELKGLSAWRKWFT
jgi:ABC-type uncharacterized transport system ATPase subunit